MYGHNNVYISIYLQVLLFHLVCHLFPFFQADPVDQWNWLFSVYCTTVRSYNCIYISDWTVHSIFIFMMLYIKSFFLLSSQGDLVVPGFLGDPLCPSENKQTQTGHRHQRKRMINGCYYCTSWLTYMVQGGGLYNNDTWVIRFLRGEYTKCSPTFSPGGPGGPGGPGWPSLPWRGKSQCQLRSTEIRSLTVRPNQNKWTLVFTSF